MSNTAMAMQAIPQEQLLGIRRGIERESLRTTSQGALSSTSHPVALGSALTHPRITTDFSESQVELITGVHATVESCLAELAEIQQFTMHALDEEMLWVSSMPCELPPDDQIPLGHYGTSNGGRARTIYRNGLGLRYGRRMQTISGIHYNWSYPGLTSEAYFGLIRNFRRHAFLLMYLFGASPAVCSSFVQGRQHSLQLLDASTMHLPDATSLRMGRLGYQSDAQASLAVSYNDLAGYVSALQTAMAQPYPAYQTLGLRDAHGQYQQLATSLLQIENEFYGTIRPKRVVQPGERALHALRARGVEYVEVRLMDLNPFEPLGIAAQTMHLLDVFLVHCLHSDSPHDSPQENAALARNQHKVAERGRLRGLMLERNGAEVALVDWADELLNHMAPIAQQLDAAYGTCSHTEAVAAASRALVSPETLPSARVLQAIQEQPGGSFATWTRDQSRSMRAQTLASALPDTTRQRFEGLAEQSLREQESLEAVATSSLDDYLAQYLSAAAV